MYLNFYGTSGPVTPVQAEEMDTTEFVLDPKDNLVLATMTGCQCGGERLKEGSPYNIGYVKGRMATFPRHSLGLELDDIEAMADDGLYWEFNGTKNGRIRCVGCNFVQYEWSKVIDVIYRHQDLSDSRYTWYMCAILGAQSLSYNTEVDITYDPVTQRRTLPFIKPVDLTRFVCDPRDYRLLDNGYVPDDRTCNSRFENNIPDRNVGRMMGRYNSYPQHSIDYADDIMQLVWSGFYWYKDYDLKNPRGILRCVHCKATITKWTPGSNADEEHRKLNPTCEYLFHRDQGCHMDVYTYYERRSEKRVEPWRCYVVHPEPSTDVVPTILKLDLVQFTEEEESELLFGPPNDYDIWDSPASSLLDSFVLQIQEEECDMLIPEEDYKDYDEFMNYLN